MFSSLITSTVNQESSTFINLLKMRSTIFELTALLGVGLFLIGTICLVTVVIHSVFPAFEEQNLREINCTIASSNMDRKLKCVHSKRNLTRYPCLRIFVFCGKGLDVKTNGSLKRRQPLLLLKDIHSLDEQVRNNVCQPWIDHSNVQLESRSQFIGSCGKRIKWMKHAFVISCPAFLDMDWCTCPVS